MVGERFGGVRHVLLAAFVATLLGCENGGASENDGTCESSAQCGDGLFCNGVEICSPTHPAANERGCLAGPPACPQSTCDEASAQCGGVCAVPDADGDGHSAVMCGGDDCDDADADRYPGNTEVCDADGHDEDCNPRTLGPDVDGDGLPSSSCCNIDNLGLFICGSDCDDTLAGVNPGATEACNGIDDDCDGVVDDGVQRSFFPDTDGDGYGDRDAIPTRGCQPPTVSHVEDQRDCDDTNRDVNPGTSELCDVLDNDCDGFVDEAGVGRFFRDADGDGFGDNGEVVSFVSCTTPQGYAANGNDCDDSDETVHPGATERCDRVDSNCSGTGADRGGVDPAEDADDDGHAPVDALCEGGFAKDDCDDTRAFIHPGATEACNGMDDDCNGPADDGAEAYCGRNYACDETCRGVHAFASSPQGRTTCTLRGDDVYCFGARPASEDPSISLWDATYVAGLEPGAVQIAVGERHACARHEDGMVSCWGSNVVGQLGDGNLAEDSAPVRVAALTDAVDIVAGSDFTCATRLDGTVVCWGRNDRRQLGVTTVGLFSSSPLVVTGVSDVISLVGAWDFVCALNRDRKVWCWGSNTGGGMGDGTIGGFRSPQSVPFLEDVQQLGASSFEVAVLSGDGNIRAWGGQFGLSPTPVTGLESVESFDMTVRQLDWPVIHTRSTSGEWLAYGVPVALPAPLPDAELLRPTIVSFPEQYPSALAGHCEDRGGAVACWPHLAAPRGIGGAQFSGPVATAFGTGGEIPRFGPDLLCGRDGDRVKCWGSMFDPEASREPMDMGINDVAQFVDVGASCARTHLGELWCWGNLGVLSLPGVPGWTSTPTLISTPGPVVWVEESNYQLRILVENGTVYAPGDPWVVESSFAGATAMALAAREDLGATCYLASGEVYCYGPAWLRGIPESSPEGTPATGVTGAVEVVMHSAGVCARTDEGTIYCWGDTASVGVTGAPAETTYSSPHGSRDATLTPQLVPLTGVDDIAPRDDGVCATADGGLHCWGLPPGGDALDPGAWVTTPALESAFAGATGPLAITAGFCATLDGAWQCSGEASEVPLPLRVPVVGLP